MKHLSKIIGLIVIAAAVSNCGPVKFFTKENSAPPPPVQPTPEPPLCPAPPCIVSPKYTRTSQDNFFTESNKVDILVITDNSGSMAQEQRNLASPLNGFIANLNSAGLDWQIAVTTTDVCSISGNPGGECVKMPDAAKGRFIGPIQTTPPYGNQYIIKKSNSQSADEQTFSSIVQRGAEIGSGDERGLYALNLAIDKRDTDNAGFFRDNSALAVVILTDENERSVGGKAGNSNEQQPLENFDLPQPLIAKMNTIWGGAKPLQFNSIIVKPDDQACIDANGFHDSPNHAGTIYKEMSDLTNGAIGSICETTPGSFANTLKQITGAIQYLPQTKTIVLGYIPVSQPTISFNPPQPQITASWVPGSNKIELSERPPGGTTVHIEYDYDPKVQKLTASSGSQKLAAPQGSILPSTSWE